MAGQPASTSVVENASPSRPWPSLYDYGLIGNQHTGALVGRDGSIDWACLPRFDSPSVFGRLLDRQRGGFHELAPVGSYVSHQQYVNGTNVLSTLFELRRGLVLGLTDFMPMGPAITLPEGEPRIVRRLVARGAPIDVTITADPRFDYARSTSQWMIEGNLARAESGSDRLALTSPWPWQRKGPGVTSSGTVVPGSPLFAQVRWGDPPGPDPTPTAMLSVTDAYWRGWVSPEDAPLRRVAARWHPWVERSELVLKLLSYASTGVFVAAPTTSLPEWPGGSRNWDYRFVWIRDAAFTAQVFLLLGHVAEARAYVGWAFDRVAALTEREEVPVVYSVDGGRPPEEFDLDHLEGYLGSRPIRVGNAAAGQRQLDVYGEILDSALLLERVDPAFVRDRWPIIERLARQTTELWSQPDQGIWEFRTEPAHYVHSKLMCWVALDRSLRLAEAFGKTEMLDRWSRVAEEIRAAILSHGYDDKLGAFTQAFDRPSLDASALRIPLTGFLPPNDPRVLRTISAVEKVLGRGPFLHRYEGDDGLSGPEGAFLLCSFWLVESLAKCGQTERALEHWRALLDAAGPLLLFSEQFDPATNRPLGNYPQAFTHIGVLRAALALGLVGSDHSSNG
ncbi:MAG: glycoside hydrolase family 15 protein [Thermoplasmata archaeon]